MIFNKRTLKYSTQENCLKIVYAFFTSNIEYSILYGLPAKQLDKIQRVQDTAAHIMPSFVT